MEIPVFYFTLSYITAVNATCFVRFMFKKIRQNVSLYGALWN